jgi:hypothetical protein
MHIAVTCAQLDRFSYFPIFAYFRLDFSKPPSNAIKKNNYVIILFIKSLPREVVLYVYYMYCNTIVGLKRF